MRWELGCVSGWSRLRGVFCPMRWHALASPRPGTPPPVHTQAEMRRRMHLRVRPCVLPCMPPNACACAQAVVDVEGYSLDHETSLEGLFGVRKGGGRILRVEGYGLLPCRLWG
jgi:hypothetical protein